MLTYGILCSGNLGLEVLNKIISNYLVKFVCTDKKSEGIIELAKKSKIPLFIGNPRKENKGYDFIKDYNVDVIASINYLFLIGNNIIEHPNLLAFNFHGSLLPKYRGRTPHVWAIINGESQTGITAHIIDKECDTGDIIKQIVVPIEKNDTGATILEKYKELYFPLFEDINNLIETNNIKLTPQNDSLSSFYGKRTPDDGEINWNWNSSKIRDWVRAQAHPYPGSFSFYNKKKIIIDSVSITNLNNISNIENGEIVSVDPFIVKTGDGSICVNKMRAEKSIFEIGKKFENENR